MSSIRLRRHRKSFTLPKAKKPKDCDLTWDYNLPTSTKNLFFGSHKDWYQTLITKINQCSAHIHQRSNIGGATVIECGSNLEHIFDDLEYYNSETKRLGNRYDVIFKKELQSTIRVYHDKKPELVMIIKTKGVKEEFVVNKRKRLLIR